MATVDSVSYPCKLYIVPVLPEQSHTVQLHYQQQQREEENVYKGLERLLCDTGYLPIRDVISLSTCCKRFYSRLQEFIGYVDISEVFSNTIDTLEFDGPDTYTNPITWRKLIENTSQGFLMYMIRYTAVVSRTEKPKCRVKISDMILGNQEAFRKNGVVRSLFALRTISDFLLEAMYTENTDSTKKYREYGDNTSEYKDEDDATQWDYMKHKNVKSSGLRLYNWIIRSHILQGGGTPSDIIRSQLHNIVIPSNSVMNPCNEKNGNARWKKKLFKAIKKLSPCHGIDVDVEGTQAVIRTKRSTGQHRHNMACLDKEEDAHIRFSVTDVPCQDTLGCILNMGISVALAPVPVRDLAMFRLKCATPTHREPWVIYFFMRSPVGKGVFRNRIGRSKNRNTNNIEEVDPYVCVLPRGSESPSSSVSKSKDDDDDEELHKRYHKKIKLV